MQTTLITLNHLTIPKPRRPKNQVLYYGIDVYLKQIFIYYQDETLLHVRRESWSGYDIKEVHKTMHGMKQVHWITPDGKLNFLPVKKVREMKMK